MIACMGLYSPDMLCCFPSLDSFLMLKRSCGTTATIHESNLPCYSMHPTFKQNIHVAQQDAAIRHDDVPSHALLNL